MDTETIPSCTDSVHIRCPYRSLTGAVPLIQSSAPTKRRFTHRAHTRTSCTLWAGYKDIANHIYTI